MTYNLLDEEWIPVLWSNGKFGHVGIKEALTQAGRIRCIAAASPLDVFAICRFLLTLLYWKADQAESVQQVRAALLRGAVPRKMLDVIQAESPYFDLLDAKKPFLQDSSICDAKRDKSVGSLFSEFASGTNIAHFHHGDDKNMRLCLQCAAIGLIRVVPWTQAGGSGLTPSVHGAPPIMAIAAGENLAVTLGLNLVPIAGKAGKVKWTGQFQPTGRGKPIPYLEALTWNPRHINLGEPQTGAVCWRCGRSDAYVVGPIVFQKNEETKKGDDGLFMWQDPAALYGEDEPYKTMKSWDESRASAGRDINVLIGKAKPKSLIIETNLGHKSWQLIIPCTNPANNKTYDYRQLELAGFSSEEIRAMQPVDFWSRWPNAMDGWVKPQGSVRQGHYQFVHSAAELFTHAEWLTLSSSAFREMHESAKAFSVFTNLFWSLRNKKVKGLPSKNVAWLVLKLMAAVPGRARVVDGNASFCPLTSLPKRQLNEQRKGQTIRSPYPVGFPRGLQLEASLRDALMKNIRNRNPKQIDWPGLCARLDQLLD